MTAEPGDAQYESKLDERSQKRAREELNELNDQDRQLAVQSFRQWVLQQKWLRTPTDFRFLLRFLRAKKFSQLLARETLENYWSAQTNSPEWFRDVDPADPYIQKMMRTGLMAATKAYDKDGRRIAIVKMSKLNVAEMKKIGGVDIFYRTFFLVLNWLILDENVQVNGLMIMFDHSNDSFSDMMTVFDTKRTNRFMHCLQDAFPVRMKGYHNYNEPVFFDVVFSWFTPFMKQKMKDRVHLHGRSMVNVYRHVDQHTLTREYLPDNFKDTNVMETDSVIEEMIAEMNAPEFRDYIRELSSGKYGVDMKDKDKDIPVASFRKLHTE